MFCGMFMRDIRRYHKIERERDRGIESVYLVDVFAREREREREREKVRESEKQCKSM